ncbi:hypothetical protein HNR42_000221 [Deinobacterium chartae]|uniref:DUF3108 domain-containing protein n=1 Tax=Deinobacterium chartae TaxID=521158 RepID=A0A841HX37_9DEIO|nr:DUF3108 domain-containing protein [Deinobacterium chartae]MBB6096809.1 hypothetical protein [Deinobacterium chartae]
MRPEELHYTLYADGKFAGESVWRVTPEKHHWLIRQTTEFVGPPIGNVRRVQTSRLNPKRRTSAAYSEGPDSSARAAKPSFETVFDRKSGVVTVRQGRDEASIPMVQDYQDPLSLIVLLRDLPADAELPLRVPMIGASAYVQRLPDALCPTPWGDLEARVYYLRPGGAVVYIEQNEPNRPLRLTQEVDGVVMDSLISLPGGRSAPPRKDSSPRREEPRRRRTRPRKENDKR